MIRTGINVSNWISQQMDKQNKPSDAIKVYARLRHTNASNVSEKDAGHYSVNQLDGTLTIRHQQQQSRLLSRRRRHLLFNFNQIFSHNTTQQRIFNECGKPLVHQAIQGYNCTLFAYGQTGSGKTYSMLGPPLISGFDATDRDNNQHGLIYRCMNELFTSTKQKDKENHQHTLIKCSFLEIYQDKMRDLLVSQRINSSSTEQKKTAFGSFIEYADDEQLNPPLKIKKRYKTHSSKPSESYVANLSEEYVSCMKDVDVFLGIAKARRATCATWSNSYSSRSHWVMIVTIEQKTHDSLTTVSKLNFVDLAGSEKVKISGVTGNSLNEAKTINKSLHNLRLCIKALASKQKHVPYRDSTLTHLLQDSLGGNTKTSLLITLNMDKQMTEETISSCRFGGEAKQVLNAAHINKRASRQQLEHLIAKLQRELSKQSSSNSNLSDTRSDISNISSSESLMELYNAKQRMIELEKSIANYETIIAKMREKKSKEKEDIGQLRRLCDELKNEKQTMEHSVKELTEELTKTQKNNQQLKEKNLDLRKDNDVLNKQMMVANNHIYDLQNTINRNDRIYVEVTNQNANLSDQFEILKQANDAKFNVLLHQLTLITGRSVPAIDFVDVDTPQRQSAHLPIEYNGVVESGNPRTDDVLHHHGDDDNAIKLISARKQSIDGDEDEEAKLDEVINETICTQGEPVMLDAENIGDDQLIGGDRAITEEMKADEEEEAEEQVLLPELEIDDNVIDFSIAPQPIICETQLMEAYFTTINGLQFQEQGDEHLYENEKGNQDEKKVIHKNKKITPTPIRLLVKIMRLISPRPRAYSATAYNEYGVTNVSRHRKMSEDVMNMNQGYTAYITPGQPEAGDME